MGLFLIGLCFILYFLPTIIGLRQQNAQAICVLNLFLGWMVIGWIVALVWALTVDPPNSSLEDTGPTCGGCGLPISRADRFCSHCAAEIDWS